MTRSKTRGTRERRAERAERILDSAAELVLRIGYDKTTIDDVARRSAVAKGTIYLHWRNREALFTALLRRERLAALTRVRELVGADSAPASLGRFCAHLALAYHERPLLMATVLGDHEILGRLARSEPAGRTGPAGSGFAEYLEALRGAGLVRTDWTVGAQVNVVTSVLAGFFTSAPLMPAELAVPAPDLAPILGETVERALAPAAPFTPDQRADLARHTADFLDRAVDISARKYSATFEQTA
ncbi:TetR family transcriptional regulator [Murinocardiopsis flavida]|uniref:TetR family transcriptional regulator n=1 Tax=Murinocardiopsis flavida TaxID=645275 RepID=A0A2P8CLZ5_9ACTN|nr:TetR/AcrR family transcriptional regulator [Murinocardiopsis flavida]PSK85994.1 TetR family transcriptional regulator [Murinocardiopsis flavida]